MRKSLKQVEKRRIKMSLQALSNLRKEQIQMLVIVAITMLLLAAAYYVAVAGGLQFSPATLLELDPGINGHCTVTSCTAVGA
jgi:hypothetical protein